MRRILVRLPNPVGDAIMATALLRELRAYQRDARIDVLGRRPARELLEGLPYFDEFVEAPRGTGAGWRAARELRRRAYDVALICPHSVGARWPIALARVPRRIGYARHPGRNWLLTERLPCAFDRKGRHMPTPMPEYYLGFLRALGGRGDPDPWPELRVQPAAAERIATLRAAHGLADAPYVVVNPGAAFGASKLWTVEGFAWVADALARETGARIVLVGGPGEGPFARSVQARMAEPAVDCCSEPLGLPGLYALIHECALVLTLDSGPRHMATAARKPCVVLMGPNDYRYTHACLDYTEVIRTDTLWCVPCNASTCVTEHECMRLIPPRRVLDACLRLWRAHVAPVPA